MVVAPLRAAGGRDVRLSARALLGLLAGLAMALASGSAQADPLAAAYAEAGRFDEAVETQEEALTLFGRDFDGYDEAVERRNLYRGGAAWRE